MPDVQIPSGALSLAADLQVPSEATRLVVFAHGSGSSRHSPRNQLVARALESRGLATLLVDLLTTDEASADALDGHLRFDIPLLARRLVHATVWALEATAVEKGAIGYFGASTGAAAALVAAASSGAEIGAVVSRGGRPDLAGDALRLVKAPTLLVVGGRDDTVLDLNRAAYERLRCTKSLEVVPGATHLFEEPGALELAARLAGDWFEKHLQPRRARDREAAERAGG